MNIHVQPEFSDNADRSLETLDFDRLTVLLDKFISAFELEKDLGIAEFNTKKSNQRLGHHLELIGDTFCDMACEASDMISKRDKQTISE